MEHTKAPETNYVELQKNVTGNAESDVVFDPKVVKSLKFKADFILLPVLTIAYLCK